MKGMDDPKCRSQIVLRRSQRLRDKLGPRRSARLSDAGPCPIYVDRGGAGYLDKLRRITREADALYFWHAYKYVYRKLSDGRLNIKELRHLVLSDRITRKSIDESHGVMSVSVHGGNYIFTVFKNRIPDMRAIDLLRGPEVLTRFGLHVLSDMEDLVDSIPIVGKKPFAVVSVTRERDNIYEGDLYKPSGDELDENKAIDFLKVKMKSDSALTKEETIKTAIAGFHYLFKKKLQPKEIRVTGFYDDGIHDHSWILSTKEIDKYLIDIDKTDEELIRHQQS